MAKFVENTICQNETDSVAQEEMATVENEPNGWKLTQEAPRILVAVAADTAVKAEGDIAPRVKINSVVKKGELAKALALALKTADLDPKHNLFDNQFSLEFAGETLKVMTRQEILNDGRRANFAVAAKIKCDTTDAGEILAKNPKVLLEYLKRIEDENVSVHFDGWQGTSRLSVKAARGELALDTQYAEPLDCKNFTSYGAAKYDYAIEIDAMGFKNVITDLLPYCHDGKGYNSRPELENICLQIRGDDFVAIAANGPVLKICGLDATTWNLTSGEILIPTQVARVLTNMLSTKKEYAGGKCTIKGGDDFIKAQYLHKGVEVEVIFKKFAMKYSDVSSILDHDKVLYSTVVNNDAMRDVLSKALIVAKKQNTSDPKIKGASLTISENGGVVYTNNFEGGEYSANINATYEGKNFEVTFDINVIRKYFIDACRISKKASTRIEIVEAGSFPQIILKNADSQKAGLDKLITMPLKYDLKSRPTPPAEELEDTTASDEVVEVEEPAPAEAAKVEEVPDDFTPSENEEEVLNVSNANEEAKVETVETAEPAPVVEVEEPAPAEAVKDTAESVAGGEIKEPEVVEAAKVEDPAPAEVLINAKLRINDKGKVKISFDGKSMVQMFELLEDYGFNFETSYGILLKAVLYGKAKTGNAKIAGDPDTTWSALPVFDKDWASHIAAKSNLKAVAAAILDGSYQVKKYKATVLTNVAMINDLLAKKFNLQRHSDSAQKGENQKAEPPIQVVIKARNYADAMEQKAQILASGGNYEIKIEIACF